VQQDSAKTRPLTKKQCWFGFSVIIRCWRTADDHRCACVPTKTLLQYTCQLAVTIRDESLQHHMSHSN